MSVKIDLIKIDIPEGTNVILGQSHFIKTVEDMYETLASSSPSLKFGFAFSEASGKRLIRWDGNDTELINIAIENCKKISSGHTFILYIKNGYPINILNRLKNMDEIVRLFAATSNPLQVLVAETDQGRGIIGVIDGYTPLGVESDDDIKERKELLRKFGYKR